MNNANVLAHGNQNAISQTIFTIRAGPQHRNSIDYEHPYDSMRRYAELLALQHDCARPRHSYYRAMRVLHEHFLGEHPAHPRRGGKPEVKERPYPPLDGALGVRPMSAAACAANAARRASVIANSPRAQARPASIALRGRLSWGWLTSKYASTRSALSVARSANAMCACLSSR